MRLINRYLQDALLQISDLAVRQERRFQAPRLIPVLQNIERGRDRGAWLPASVLNDVCASVRDQLEQRRERDLLMDRVMRAVVKNKFERSRAEFSRQHGQ